MKIFVILLVAALCSGLASGILLVDKSTVTFAQVVDPPPTNGTGMDPGGNTTTPIPPPPPVEPPLPPPVEPPLPPVEPEPPAGNETTDEEPVILLADVVSTNPCMEYDEETNMVHVLCDADIYELFAGLRDDSVTQQLGSGEILINSNITVDEGATFSINSDGGINYVKIGDNNGITVLGTIHIDDIKITSWDSANNTVIPQNDTGSAERAFLFLSGSEESHIFNSELGFMGYNATGYRGVDLIDGSHNFAIVNSTFHHMWYAFYSNGAFNVTIDSSEYYDNHLYAVDPHTGTYNMTIKNNIIYRNPVGLVCSLDCYDILFEGNTMYNNSGAGIFFSRNTHNSIARNNTIYDQPIGIAFSESSNNRVYGNNISSVGRGIFLNNPVVQDDGSTTNNRIYNNTISDSAVGVSALRTTENIVSNNNFYNITISHYRLAANSALTIANQTFDNAMIEGQEGDNIVTFANSTAIMIGSETYDASLEHAVMLSNQTVMVSSVPRE